MTDHDHMQRALIEALQAILPYAEHSDSCGDHDAYNHAEVPSCGCGLDSAKEQAGAAIAAALRSQSAQAVCPACKGLGYTGHPMDGERPVDCPDCAGSGLAEHSITANEAAQAVPEGDGMLPDELCPHATEWYSLCERAAYVDRIKISGPLAEAIIATICRLNSAAPKPEGR